MDIILGLKNKKNKNYNYLITETVNSAGNLHLSLINNVFSDEECSNLIIYSENVGYVQASSYIDKYKKEHFFMNLITLLTFLTPLSHLIFLNDQSTLDCKKADE